jgi:hypothetical protein
VTQVIEAILTERIWTSGPHLRTWRRSALLMALHLGLLQFTWLQELPNNIPHFVV